VNYIFLPFGSFCLPAVNLSPNIHRTVQFSPTASRHVSQEEQVTIITDRGIAITNPKDLGELLRKKRKVQNLTQVQVAEFSGVSVKFISEVERGKKTAEIGKVLYLLNTLGIDLIADTRD